MRFRAALWLVGPMALVALCAVALAQDDVQYISYSLSERDVWEAGFHDPTGADTASRLKLAVRRTSAELQGDFVGAGEGAYACIATGSPCGARRRDLFRLETENAFVAEVRYRNLTSSSKLMLAWGRLGKGGGLGSKELPHRTEWGTAFVDITDPKLNGGRGPDAIGSLHLHLVPGPEAGTERVEIESVKVHSAGVADFDGLTSEYRRTADAALRQAADMPASQARAVERASDDIKATIEDFGRTLVRSRRVQASTYAEYRKRLDSQVGKLERALDVAQTQKAVAETGKEQGYLVQISSAMTKVFREQPPAGQPAGVAAIRSARNEYESFQLLLVAGTEALANVRVRASDLRRADGEAIDNDHIEIRRVGYVNVKSPTPGGGAAGWWPDPLFPNVPFAVEPSTVQPLFLTVYTPYDAEPGDYTGSVTIEPEGRPATEVPVRLHVYGFVLPRERHLKTPMAACTLLDNYVSGFDDFYPPEKYPRDELLPRFYAFIQDHRIDVSRVGWRHLKIERPEGGEVKLDFSEADPYIELCMGRGLQCLDVFSSAGAPYGGAEVRQWSEYLKQKGWHGKAFAYALDEPPPDALGEVANRAKAIQEADPAIPRMCTTPPNEVLEGLINVWCPLSPHITPEFVAERHAKGDQIWSYVCIGPKKPPANFFIDYPGTDPRVLFWWAYKCGLDGFLYYAMDTWQIYGKNHPATVPDFAAAAEGKAWGLPHFNPLTWGDGNGDGLLMYPGPDGPWSSLRLEIIRDGIEDYEYLATLRDRQSDLKELDAGNAYTVLRSRIERVLAVSDGICANVNEYTDDPQRILDARQEAADVLEDATTAVAALRRR